MELGWWGRVDWFFLVVMNEEFVVVGGCGSYKLA